jgi:hypothetical protein
MACSKRTFCCVNPKPETQTHFLLPAPEDGVGSLRVVGGPRVGGPRVGGPRAFAFLNHFCAHSRNACTRTHTIPSYAHACALLQHRVPISCISACTRKRTIASQTHAQTHLRQSLRCAVHTCDNLCAVLCLCVCL